MQRVDASASEHQGMALHSREQLAAVLRSGTHSRDWGPFCQCSTLAIGALQPLPPPVPLSLSPSPSLFFTGSVRLLEALDTSGPQRHTCRLTSRAAARGRSAPPAWSRTGSQDLGSCLGDHPPNWCTGPGTAPLSALGSRLGSRFSGRVWECPPSWHIPHVTLAQHRVRKMLV